MATIIINEEKKGAQEMLNFLGTLDFVTSLETASETKQVQLRRQNLIRYPQEYNPMALAGAAEEFPLSLSHIRKNPLLITLLFYWTAIFHYLELIFIKDIN